MLIGIDLPVKDAANRRAVGIGVAFFIESVAGSVRAPAKFGRLKFDPSQADAAGG